MTVLVCGGRHFDDGERLFRLLDAIHKLWPIDRIVHGGATGADKLGGLWARINRAEVVVYWPEWDRFGSAAGPIRNQAMLDGEHPSLVVAAPGTNGTADMVRRARLTKVPVVSMEVR